MIVIIMAATALMEAYDTGVLVQGVHSRLAQNLDHFAQRAGIDDIYILRKMSQFQCTEAEIAYVRTIKRASANGVHGLVYSGKETRPTLTRMMGVTGACVRNFIDAKVITIQELLADMKAGDIPQATVLCVPNFFVAKENGGKIADWHIAELLGVLYARMAKAQQTLLYVSDAKALRTTYGDPIADHIKNNFAAIPA